jgi:ATP-dependent Clp protease, protease subunit
VSRPMTGRYILPSYVERTSYGMKESNPYNKLFEERIVFVGAPVDDTLANDVIAQLVALEGMDPDRVISLYINSPGGSLTAMTAIYDTMQFIKPEIETTCIGQAVSAAAVLLAGGTTGKRAALPHARIVIHQPSTEGGYGQTSDMEIQAKEIIRQREQLEAILARHTGRPLDQVRADIERDRYLTAEEARDYGLIDEIITSRKAG